LAKNLEKQKALYEVFSEDKINIDIYKDKAELLRNEEKKLRQDIKSIQLKILEKRNSVNLVKATQDFLLKLRSNPNTQQMDYLIKTFMRIIFKGIYIQNQEIVKVDINQPWKMCYDEALKVRYGEEGVKCQTKREMTPKRAKTRANRGMETEPKAKVPRRESVYFCVPSAGRMSKYREMILRLLKKLNKKENR
jgi:hypothetical protein